MRKIFIICCVVLIISSIPLLAIAHSGRTDSHGGHHDNINGGYHYHHGYSAHQHPNGECPYKTSATTSSQTSYSSTSNSKSTGGISLPVSDIICIVLVVAFVIFLFIYNTPYRRFKREYERLKREREEAQALITRSNKVLADNSERIGNVQNRTLPSTLSIKNDLLTQFESTYNQILEYTKKSDIVLSSAEIEIIPFLATITDHIVASFGGDRQSTIRQIMDKYIPFLTSTPEIDTTESACILMDQRMDIYGKIIRGELQPRYEWNLFEEVPQADIYMKSFSALCDILVNPACSNDYENAPVCIHGLSEVMQFSKIALNYMYPEISNYCLQIKDIITGGSDHCDLSKHESANDTSEGKSKLSFVNILLVIPLLFSIFLNIAYIIPTTDDTFDYQNSCKTAYQVLSSNFDTDAPVYIADGDKFFHLPNCAHAGDSRKYNLFLACDDGLAPCEKCFSLDISESIFISPDNLVYHRMGCTKLDNTYYYPIPSQNLNKNKYTSCDTCYK